MASSQNTEVLDLLKNQNLLRGLSEGQLHRILQLIKVKTYSTGHTILKEGENSHQLYMILEGQVEVLKWDENYQEQFTIGLLQPGDAFGEISFVDKEPRSSSIRAIKDTKLVMLDQESLNVKDPKLKAIYNHLISNILNLNTQRIRNTSKNYVEALKEKCEQLQMRHEFAKVFIIVLICFGINNFFNVLTFTYRFDDKTILFNWSYILLFLIPIIIFMIKEHVPPQTFGVTFKNAARSLKEGALISIASFVLFLGFLYFYETITYTSWGILLQHIINTYTNPAIILYFFHVYAQEFIARGAFQTSIQRFFNDKNGYKAILIASFVFFVFHLHRGILFAIVTFILSIFFGLIYFRQRNLIGVTLVHFTIGTFGKVFSLF